MDVKLTNVSKRFQYRYIIKNCNLHLSTGTCYGIKGANGSGKTTLLKMIAGYLSHSKGSIEYFVNDKAVSRDEVYQYLSFAAPYTDLIDELTLGELLSFYQKHKALIDKQDHDSFCELLQRDYEKEMFLSDFSSGMYQRVRLGLAILSDTPLLLLDEPSSYLDLEAKRWFIDLLAKYKNDKTVLICSNDEIDFELCRQIYDVGEWA